ncbi:hypothetical protein PJP09_29025, partial [Mycobacterium kansasii]
TMLHTTGDPFDTQLQQSQLQWLYSSDAAAIGLAENYTGLPLTGRDVLRWAAFRPTGQSPFGRHGSRRIIAKANGPGSA